MSENPGPPALVPRASQILVSWPSLLACLALTGAILAACAPIKLINEAPPSKAENAPAEAPPAPEPETVVVEEPGIDEEQIAILGPASIREPAVTAGLLLPLSGPRSAWGKALLDAALMAMHENGNRELRLVPLDTGGTADGALAAASTALGEGAQMLIGPVFRDAVRAVAPLAAARDIPIISFSNDPAVAAPGVHLLGFSFSQQIDRVVAEAAANGATRFAALIPQTPYGFAVLGAYQQAVARIGGIDVGYEAYAGDGSDAAEAVRRLGRYDARKSRRDQRFAALENTATPAAAAERAKLEKVDTLGDLPFDAVLLPEGGQTLRIVAPLLPYYDMGTDVVQVLGTGLWDDRSLAQETALHGAWFAAAEPGPVLDFQQRFADLFDRQAARIATLGYDAVTLAANLATNAPVQTADSTASRASRSGAVVTTTSPSSPSSPSSSSSSSPADDPYGASSETNFSDDTADQNLPYYWQALKDPNGFTGVDGRFRFDENGIAERGLAVLEIGAAGPVVVAPAPDRFELAVPTN